MTIPRAAYGKRHARGVGRSGFTLVEGAMTALVGGLLLVAALTFFSDFTRRHGHQEDTLSSAHQAQLLMEHLRRDIRHLDGQSDGGPVSSDSETGTTYSKFWVHALHVPGGAKLELFPRRRNNAAEPLPAVHPAYTGLSASDAAGAKIRRQLSRIENAFAWISENPDDDDAPRSLVLNTRDGTTITRVRYVYQPLDRSITRYSDGPPVRIAAPSLRNFFATPYVELIYDPQDPGFRPRLGKVWLEVQFDMAQDDGPPGSKRIASRYVGFSTRLLPFLLNASLRSDWSL